MTLIHLKSPQLPHYLLKMREDAVAFAINYFFLQSVTCCSVFASFHWCVYVLLSREREQQQQNKTKSESFLDTTPVPLLCKCFLFLFSPSFSTHELRVGWGGPPKKLYQMVNSIIETKEPNGSPSSLHASGSERRSPISGN